MIKYPASIDLISVPLTAADFNANTPPPPDWRYYKARRGDGVCWAVVHDGLTAHEGPLRFEDEFHGSDFSAIVSQLIGHALAARACNPGN